MGMHVSEEDARYLCQKMDENGDGQIQFVHPYPYSAYAA